MIRLVAGMGAFLFLASCAAIWLAPASWADWALQRASGGVIGLAEPRGFARAGQGRVQAILPGGEAVALESVRWDLALAGLVAGRMHWQVRSLATGAPVADLSLGALDLTVDAEGFELPAALLGAFLPALRQAAFSGRLTVSARQLRLRRGVLAGDIRVLWADASSGLVPPGPLGSYRIDIRGDAEGGLEGGVTTLAGAALGLAGGFRKPVGQPLRLDIRAEPAEAHRQRLAALLNIVGREVRPGVYQLEADTGVGLGMRRAVARSGIE